MGVITNTTLVVPGEAENVELTVNWPALLLPPMRRANESQCLAGLVDKSDTVHIAIDRRLRGCRSDGR